MRLAAAALLAWLAGLLVFDDSLPAPAAAAPAAEAVVVLTGGRGRIDAALDLLERGAAARLLISGVGRGVRAKDLGGRVERHAGRIDFGREAATTLENARETAAWAAGRGFRRVVLVTGATHMPRSLLAFRHLAPEVEALPHPVADRDEEAVQSASIGWLFALATEYTKYLVASAYLALGARAAEKFSAMHLNS